VGREIERIWETGVKRCVKLINAGRKAGSIPPGPPARAVALALLGALEGAVIALAGHLPHDELLAARAVAGVPSRSRVVALFLTIEHARARMTIPLIATKEGYSGE
jgi:hypothetical protein